MLYGVIENVYENLFNTVRVSLNYGFESGSIVFYIYAG